MLSINKGLRCIISSTRSWISLVFSVLARPWLVELTDRSSPTNVVKACHDMMLSAKLYGFSLGSGFCMRKKRKYKSLVWLLMKHVTKTTNVFLIQRPSGHQLRL